MNGLNKHLGADGIRLHVQCWLTHANIQHFINKAIKFAVTFRDDVVRPLNYPSSTLRKCMKQHLSGIASGERPV